MISAAVVAVLLQVGTAGVLTGQEVGCPGATIRNVFVDNHSIFNTASLAPDSRFGWIYRSANRLHHRTRASFIRKELLFTAGDCLNSLLLAESERILRAYPFLSEVDIYPVEMPDGEVHVVVDTEDEWTTKFTAGVDLETGNATTVSRC